MVQSDGVACMTVGRSRRISSRRRSTSSSLSLGQMQQQAPERALKWRLDLRQMFEAYFGKGYRAVDFVLRRDHGFGRYLLAAD